MINQARMDAITGGDKALEKQLLELFQQTAQSVLDRLKAGEDWANTVHELKGAAANLGVEVLQVRCADIEHKMPSEAEKKVFFQFIEAQIAEIAKLST